MLQDTNNVVVMTLIVTLDLWCQENNYECGGVALYSYVQERLLALILQWRHKPNNY